MDWDIIPTMLPDPLTSSRAGTAAVKIASFSCLPMLPAQPITIRRAVAADAAALSALMHASSAYRGAYAAILQGYAVTPVQVERDVVFAGCGGERVLGFYALANLAAEPELDLMFVADAAQGSGVGALLFNHMRDTARALGVGQVKIVSHPPAEKFYLRMGAQRVGAVAPAGRVTWPRPLLRLSIEP
jgi:GNAT superfamily N-acetyltransferase